MKLNHEAEYICECEIWLVPTLYPVQELIRCKDCLYSTCIEEDDDWWECEHDHRVNHGDGFCNWAERKEK